MSYDIELDELRLDIDEKTRDNTRAIQDALLNIQTILNDINARLEALE
jgi:hypothetical protein